MLDSVTKWLFHVVAAGFVTACLIGLAKRSLEAPRSAADLEDQAFQDKQAAVTELLLAHTQIGCPTPTAAAKESQSPQRQLRDDPRKTGRPGGPLVAGDGPL
jgi:hypothetical protein